MTSQTNPVLIKGVQCEMLHNWLVLILANSSWTIFIWYYTCFWQVNIISLFLWLKKVDKWTGSYASKSLERNPSVTLEVNWKIENSDFFPC